MKRRVVAVAVGAVIALSSLSGGEQAWAENQSSNSVPAPM